MQRRYVTLTDELRQLAIGDYILDRAAVLEDEETGEVELLLVVTDTRLSEPHRRRARYVLPGERVEIDNDISFHFFVGAQQQLRGVIDAPAHLALRRVAPPAVR